MKHTAVVLLALAATLAACSKDPASSGGPQPQAVAPAQPGGAVQGPQAAISVTGEVVETMDAAAYTYVRLKTAEGYDVWAAGPKTTVEVGQQLLVRDAMEMKDFESTSLGRTFEKILFAAALVPPGAAGAAPAGAGGAADGAKKDPHAGMAGVPGGDPHAGMAAGMAGNPHAGMAAPGRPAIARQEVAAVPRAEGEQGRTIAEVHEQAAALAGQPVAVRGVVVKFSPGIMGRNWVHLQDATGDPEKGTHDLTVTTQDAVKPGDRVKVEGTLAKDRDFGAGYEYPVIVEDAKVAVEM
jgi:hypothetical protein